MIDGIAHALQGFLLLALLFHIWVLMQRVGEAESKIRDLNTEHDHTLNRVRSLENQVDEMRFS